MFILGVWLLAISNKLCFASSELLLELTIENHFECKDNTKIDSKMPSKR